MNKETAIVYNIFFIMQMGMRINVGCLYITEPRVNKLVTER